MATTFRLSELLLDRRYQVRHGEDPGIIARYASAYQAGVAMPPIKVVMVDGVPTVIDGWHRVAALRQCKELALQSGGDPEIEAEIVQATARELTWLAGKANLSHGKQLKSSEVRKVFRGYIRARQHLDAKGGLKSYREIAKELNGVKQHTTIRNWMKQDFPRIAARYGSEETPHGTGGLHESEAENPNLRSAIEGLEAAKVAARGVTSARDRGRLVELAGELLAALEAAGPWEAQDF